MNRTEKKIRQGVEEQKALWLRMLFLLKFRYRWKLALRLLLGWYPKAKTKGQRRPAVRHPGSTKVRRLGKVGKGLH